MCPSDTTPNPRTMTRTPDEPEFVQPRSDLDSEQATSTVSSAPRPGAAEMRRRPGLPDHPQRTTADVEDEDADPVGSGKSGLSERVPSDSELPHG